MFDDFTSKALKFGKKAKNKIVEIDKKLDIALGVPQFLSFHDLPDPNEK